MAILAQNKLTLGSSRRQFHTPHAPIFRVDQLRCSAATTGPKTEPVRILNVPSSSRVSPKLDGDDPSSLLSTWSHRAWVASGCGAVLGSLARAASGHAWLEAALAGLAGYLAADLASGVYHWGIDNYGGASTPMFGSQIEAFQGHHRRPSTITRRQFANNLHALARATAFALLPVDVLCHDQAVHGFVGVFAGCVMFSQQFHAWAHLGRSRVPPPVAALQDLGVLVSRAQHGAHHRPPYNNNYCIVSGIWNELLDEVSVFQALEMVLFFKLGVRPRSWTEPNSEWTQESESPTIPTQITTI